MELVSIEGNTQRLDGGAMFGNCPKPVWEKWAPPDEKNRITLACRALLVKEGNRNVLLETGIGAFFEPKMRERFGVQEDRHVLIESLAKAGLAPNDIDVIVLSHLHFDHAGGLLAPWSEGGTPSLVFPKASYVVSERSWERANSPHSRDRAQPVRPLLFARLQIHCVVPRHLATQVAALLQARCKDVTIGGVLRIKTDARVRIRSLP